jgi:hypothetical protein
MLNAALSPIRATYTAHLILLDFINRIIFGEDHWTCSASPLTFQSLPVTILATRFNILKFCVQYYTASTCFVWLSGEINTFALYFINRLVFMTDAESVYCAVRTEALYKTCFVLKVLMVYLTMLSTTYKGASNDGLAVSNELEMRWNAGTVT